MATVSNYTRFSGCVYRPKEKVETFSLRWLCGTDTLENKVLKRPMHKRVRIIPYYSASAQIHFGLV